MVICALVVVALKGADSRRRVESVQYAQGIAASSTVGASAAV